MYNFHLNCLEHSICISLVLVLNHSSNNTVFCLHGFVSLKKPRKWRTACTCSYILVNMLLEYMLNRQYMQCISTGDLLSFHNFHFISFLLGFQHCIKYTLSFLVSRWKSDLIVVFEVFYELV